jgi:hypothetical protein
MIGCLHTASIHHATFDALVDEFGPEFETVVVVNEAVLGAARRLGPDHHEVGALIVLST